MSLAVVRSRAQLGVHAPLVTVETHLSNGMPQLSIVGLPETAVKESKDRVRSALVQHYPELPRYEITGMTVDRQKPVKDFQAAAGAATSGPRPSRG